MTPAEHYRRAEQFLEQAAHGAQAPAVHQQTLIAYAQVHATLATAVTASSEVTLDYAIRLLEGHGYTVR